jgi:hypothetical protein
MVVQHTCIARPSIPRCGGACKHRTSRVITLRAHRVVENWILGDPDRLDVAHVRPVHDGLTMIFDSSSGRSAAPGWRVLVGPAYRVARAAGQIPIDRSGGRAAAEALATATLILESCDA